MAVLLNQLRLDHINLSRLLNLLEIDITALQSGEKADYLRMQDIMKYMIDYPDVFHHPCEEILFDKLHGLGRKEAATVAQLRSEHLYLAELGQKLADLLKHATGGHIVSRDEVLNAAEEYREIMRNHLTTEEREIYPLIEANLTKADWDDAVAKTGELSDPIFGGPVADEYSRLFDSITRQKAAG
ncbi:MAG: hemerythrin domain-containing protein [Gammaproteobacteria bacterium]|jgi:hemerythrin-like domain-containing protein